MARALAACSCSRSSRPRLLDEEHTYGQSKAEYFASGVEGVLICVAALGIGGQIGHACLTLSRLNRQVLGASPDDRCLDVKRRAA
jgi:divalent metal cation (Fe/Co/Zn/Cd) transporter